MIAPRIPPGTISGRISLLAPLRPCCSRPNFSHVDRSVLLNPSVLVFAPGRSFTVGLNNTPTQHMEGYRLMTRLLGLLTVGFAIGLGAFGLASAQGEKENCLGHSHGMSGGMGRMMGRSHTAERPLISLALEHKDQLGLTSDQVKALEALRTEFQKEAIRRSADLQIAEMDLAELLGDEPVDLTKVEAKRRQVEGLRTDIRLSRIKTLEKGEAVLTLEQRKKLDSPSPRASADAHTGVISGQGMEEMQRFMTSERMPQAMSAMMEMARRMGNGDVMAGMDRMMEMMSTMGQMGGMMGPMQPLPSK